MMSRPVMQKFLAYLRFAVPDKRRRTGAVRPLVLFSARKTRGLTPPRSPFWRACQISDSVVAILQILYWLLLRGEFRRTAEDFCALWLIYRKRLRRLRAWIA